MLPVTVAASSSTHFVYEGDLYPRTFYVFPSRADDARLVSGSWSLEVPLGSTVAGSVPADQDALIDALAALVTPASASGSGASAAEIGAAVNTLPALDNNIDGTIVDDDEWELAAAANATAQWRSIFNTSNASLQVREGATGLGRPLSAQAGGIIETRDAVYVKGATGQTFNVMEG